MRGWQRRRNRRKDKKRRRIKEKWMTASLHTTIRKSRQNTRWTNFTNTSMERLHPRSSSLHATHQRKYNYAHAYTHNRHLHCPPSPSIVPSYVGLCVDVGSGVVYAENVFVYPRPPTCVPQLFLLSAKEVSGPNPFSLTIISSHCCPLISRIVIWRECGDVDKRDRVCRNCKRIYGFTHCK